MNEHIAEIRQAFAASKVLWRGQMLIDEESFYIAVVKLRKSIATLARAPRSADSLCKYLDAIENLIESSTFRLAGRVLVRPADFEPHLQALDAALRDLPRFEPAPESAELTIEEARLEAARIINEAHHEADEIRRRARGSL